MIIAICSKDEGLRIKRHNVFMRESYISVGLPKATVNTSKEVTDKNRATQPVNPQITRRMGATNGMLQPWRIAADSYFLDTLSQDVAYHHTLIGAFSSRSTNFVDNMVLVDEDASVPDIRYLKPLRMMATAAFARAHMAVNVWEKVRAAANESPLERYHAFHAFQPVAESFERTFRMFAERHNEDVKRYCIENRVNGVHARIIESLNVLSLASADDFRSLLEFIAKGRIAGEWIPLVAEGAALVFLSSLSTQAAYVAHTLLQRSTRPLYAMLRGIEVAAGAYERSLGIDTLKQHWRQIRSDIDEALSIFFAVSHTINKSFAAIVSEEQLLSPASKAIISSIRHMYNNRLQTMQNLNFIKADVDDVLNDELMVEKALSMVVEWHRNVEGMTVLPFSNEETNTFVARRFPGVEVSSEGSVSGDINKAILNIITTHFILNALSHSSKKHTSEIVVRQAPYGLWVKDNGTGISVARLKELEKAIHKGYSVESDHNDGTGQGLLNSVTLLSNLTKLPAVLTLSSAFGEGTLASVSWEHGASLFIPDLPAPHWHQMQFSTGTDAAHVKPLAPTMLASLPRIR